MLVDILTSISPSTISHIKCY